MSEIEVVDGVRRKTETLPRRKLMEEIFVNGQLDSRFSDDTSEGAFLPYHVETHEIGTEREWFPVVRLNGLIVGYAELTPSSFSSKYLNLHMFVIAKDLRGLRRSESDIERELKLSEHLLQEVVEFARKKRCGLSVPIFTAQGRERIRQKTIDMCYSQQVPLLIPGYATEKLLKKDTS